MRIIPFVLFLGLFLNISAQEYSTDSRRAARKFDKAVEAYSNRNSQEALEYALSALEIDSEFAEAYYLCADIYGGFADYENRLRSLRKAVEYKPYVLGFLNLAKTELYLGHYAQARSSVVRAREKDDKKQYTTRLNELLRRAEFGMRSKANPVDFFPENLGKKVNSPFDDYLPSLSLDETKLIFTRAVKRKGVQEIRNQRDTQEDFYLCSKNEDGSWSKAKPIGRVINTAFNEGAQNISPDGKILFFTSCQNAGNDSPHGKSYGSCDIFYSVKTPVGWGQAVNAGKNVNSRYWESQPCFAGDGKTLYFISNRPGGQGESDIWTCKLQPNGKWSKAQNLGDKINSPGKEQSPFIHPDNHTLYFASNGHQGMGKSDLYIARRDSTGNWGKPQNLGYPINTHKEEFSLVINGKGNKAYFAADNEDGFGRLDLYRFDLPEIYRPVPTSYIKGVVYDTETKERLYAKLVLIDIETDKQASAGYSDKNNGDFILSLPSGKTYALNISKEGYLFYSENFKLKKSQENQDYYYLDVPLQPIKKGYKIVLKNVFFDTDKYELRPESLTELNKLYDFLKNNPDLEVEIGGHTDNVGTDAHNDRLSENRAKSVCDFLTEKGISESRLSYKGYGSSEPIAPNDKPENRQKNRRTECKIIKHTKQ